jgi:hypothetical protein
MSKMNTADLILFKIPFDETLMEHEPTIVRLRLKPKRGLGQKSPPEIDTSKPFEFKATNPEIPGEAKDYLKFSDPEALPGLTVRFNVEPSQKLLDTPNFNRIVREEFTVTVTVKLKAERPGGPQRELSGEFRAKVQNFVMVHWEWESHPKGFLIQSGHDQAVVLQPDGHGNSWFKLKVWTMEWRPRQQQLVPSDPNAYEFSHWIAPGDPNMNTQIFAPDPLPWSKKIKDDNQAENIWRSEADLPNSTFNRLAVETLIRVKAWNRKAIVDRLPDNVITKDGEVELGEVEIPVRLVKTYTLTIDVFLDGDDEPLGTFNERVTGERVKIFCLELPTDVKANIRWKVTGPVHFFGGKRRFQTDPKDTALVPVTAPAGQECLGTEIEIVESPCSEANPPISLDASAPAYELKLDFGVTEDRIRGDEEDRTTAKIEVVSTRSDGRLDQITKVNATFTVVGGKASDPVVTPNGAEADVVANWSEKDSTITIGGELEVTLERRDASKAVVLKTSLVPVEVQIIGAKPDLKLLALQHVVDADGRSIATIMPHLSLFDEQYDGDLLIQNLHCNTDFFEAQGVVGSPSPNAQILSPLKLRCKFHLRDNAFMSLSPYGSEVSFDVIFPPGKFAPHYPNGIQPLGLPVEIEIRPSKVEIRPDPLPPQTSPRDVNDPKHLFDIGFQVFLQSASGVRLQRSAILDGGLSSDQIVKRDRWQLEFSYESKYPVAAPHEMVSNRGLVRDSFSFLGPAANPLPHINAIDVNEQGQLQFRDVKGQFAEECCYDHQVNTWDPKTYLLGGQNCFLKVVLKACDIEQEQESKVWIKKQSRCLSESWDYTRFHFTKGKPELVIWGSWQSLVDYLVEERAYPDNRTTPLRLTRLQLLQRPIPVGTVLVKGNKDGHHGIVIRSELSGKIIIGHFLKAHSTHRTSMWFNRDQAVVMDEQAHIMEDKQPIDFDEARVYHDSLELFFKRDSKYLSAPNTYIGPDDVEVWPPYPLWLPGPLAPDVVPPEPIG